MRYLLPLFMAALLLAGCNTTPLTTEQKAAKLLIVGVVGNSLNADNAIVRDIKERGVGGVILFENNINPNNSREEMSRFIADIKALSREPLFVAIDQEGGLVNRMKSKYGFADMPSQQSVGEAEGESYAQETAKMIAKEVAAVGINLNFAPCVDVNINPDCPVIGRVQRSFSADEERVGALAKIYIDAHHNEGVLTAIKHFPGHGSSLKDSHFGLTDITNTWQERELIPYRTLIDSGSCDMVMVSHLFNTTFDTKYPATLSHKILDGVLRREMGWDGVVVSDDMQMKAITDHYGFEEAVTIALNAGVDLFIFSRRSNTDDIAGRFISIIERGVESGKIEMERLDEAVERVEKLRNRL